MEEIFDSEYFTVEFDKDIQCSVLTWKKYEEVDNFRTPLMKAADMVRRHNGDILILDRTVELQVAPKDQAWVSKVFVTALKQSGCKKIIIVAGDKKYDLTRYPFDVLSKKFELEVAKTREEAIKSLIPEQTISVEEALKFMDLPMDANDYAIDERFWQMSKRIRSAGGDDYEQKLDELSNMYDIASGRKGSRDKALAARDRKKKFMGKTADEWKTYFSYTWFRYLMIIVAVIVVGNLCYHMFIKPKIDCGVVSIGHFALDGDYYEKMLMEEMGFKNAYVNTADVVVPNEEGQVSSAYAEQTADSILLAEPNIVVTDSLTTPYYYPAFVDMTDTYNMFRQNLPESVFKKLKPVYLSERQYYALVSANEQATALNNPDTDTSLDVYSPEVIMIGIMVDDPEYLEAMGYTSYWKETPVRLVYSIYVESKDYTESQQVLERILKDTLLTNR